MICFHNSFINDCYVLQNSLMCLFLNHYLFKAKYPGAQKKKKNEYMMYF